MFEYVVGNLVGIVFVGVYEYCVWCEGLFFWYVECVFDGFVDVCDVYVGGDVDDGYLF